MTDAKRAKPRYKTTNWAAYNAALKARGSLMLWLCSDTPDPVSGKWGR